MYMYYGNYILFCGTESLSKKPIGCPIIIFLETHFLVSPPLLFTSFEQLWGN